MNTNILIESIKNSQLSLFGRNEESSVQGIPIDFGTASSRSYDVNSVNNSIRDAFDDIPEYLIQWTGIRKINVDSSLSEYLAKVDVSQRTLRIAPTTDKKKLASSICHEMVHVLLASNADFRNTFFSKEIVQEYKENKREVLKRIVEHQRKGWARWIGRIDQRWIQKVASELKHNDQFEEFLKKRVGYPFIFQIAGKLIPEPYMILSLEEYICVGFQYFYFENYSVLKNGSNCHNLLSAMENYVDRNPVIHQTKNNPSSFQEENFDPDPEEIEHFKKLDQVEEEYPHWPWKEKMRYIGTN